MKRWIDVNEMFPFYSLCSNKRESMDDVEYDFTDEEIAKIEKAVKIIKEAQAIFETKISDT